MIARSDGSPPETERVDVTAARRANAPRCGRPFADERGVQRRHRRAGDGLVVTAVPNALEQIIDNYVDNALGVAHERRHDHHRRHQRQAGHASACT